MRDKVSQLQIIPVPWAMICTAQPSNLLSAFLEELLGRFLLQPLTTGIYQL